MKANIANLVFDHQGFAWGEILEREGFEILPLVRNVKYRAPEVIELLNYKPFGLTGDDLLKSRAIRDELAFRYVGKPYSEWLGQFETGETV